MTRFGLIGYGAIGKLRAQAMLQTPGAQLSLIVEPVAERREQAASDLHVRTSSTIEEAASDEGVDAFIISTPPNLHRGHCERVLRAGKPVLVEKPLATTVEDCRAIVECAKESGKILAVGFNYRFYPAIAKARELIEGGAIGTVDHVKSFAGHPGGPEFTHPWVHDPSIMGGGALMDNGIHVADLTLHFLGPVVQSAGIATDNIWHFGASEDNGYVMMKTAAGQVGLMHASWSEWRGYRFYLDIYGTEGCIRVWYPPMMTVLHKRPVGSAKKGRRKVYLFPMFQVNERLRSYRWTVIRSFVAEHLDFMQRLAGGHGVGATGEDGTRAVELAASAYGPSSRAAAKPTELAATPT